MALGANTRDVLALVLTGAGRVLATGLFTGLVLSIFAAHQLSGRMEGMGNADALLFITTPVVLIAAAIAACLVPARAATSIPPIDALRHE
jgi:ABC-type antimicrobial peptide transport system permease subunit